MGDKQRADCVAAKPGPPVVRRPGEQGEDEERKKREEGGSPKQLTFTFFLWPAQEAQAAALRERGRERTPSLDGDTVRK